MQQLVDRFPNPSTRSERSNWIALPTLLEHAIARDTHATGQGHPWMDSIVHSITTNMGTRSLPLPTADAAALQRRFIILTSLATWTGLSPDANSLLEIIGREGIGIRGDGINIK